MKTTTVENLSIEEYLELIEYKKNVLSGNKVCIRRPIKQDIFKGNTGIKKLEHVTFYTDDQIAIELKETIKDLHKYINTLQEIIEVKNKVYQKQNSTIIDEMSKIVHMEYLVNTLQSEKRKLAEEIVELKSRSFWSFVRFW